MATAAEPQQSLKVNVEKKELGFQLGLTIKSLALSDDETKLNLSYTIVIKMDEDEFDNVTFNVNKTGDVKPDYRNKRDKSEPASNMSCSAHRNDVISYTNRIDCCPFTISTYDLSVKCNALNEASKRNKRKVVFVSRTVREFLEFQTGSIQSDISVENVIDIESISKVRKELESSGLEKKTRFRVSEDRLCLNEDQYETDELIFRFIIINSQIPQLTTIVLPCALIPIIFAELARTNTSSSSNLFTGLLTLVFTMPSKFSTHTFVWYFASVLFTIVIYSINTTRAGLILEILVPIVFTLFYAYSYYKVKTLRAEMGKLGCKFKSLIKD